jgi:hypothetical protein
MARTYNEPTIQVFKVSQFTAPGPILMFDWVIFQICVGLSVFCSAVSNQDFDIIFDQGFVPYCSYGPYYSVAVENVNYDWQ